MLSPKIQGELLIWVLAITIFNKSNKNKNELHGVTSDLDPSPLIQQSSAQMILWRLNKSSVIKLAHL